MKNILSFSCAALFALVALPSNAQRNCGTGILIHKLATQDPQMLRQLRSNQKQLVDQAIRSEVYNSKATAQSAIPVVFHFVVTPDQYTYLGGDTGIIRRVKSQLSVLNQDFNGTNADKASIPTAFKSLYANVGIQFGLARATSASTISAGIEVKKLTTNSTTGFDVNNSCAATKTSTTGLVAWDVDKYFNVWVCNISNGSSAGTILGVTTPPSFVGGNTGTHIYTSSEQGVVLSYGTVGSRDFAAQKFYTGIDKGRTLTHETGHFFELWHTWGDDDGHCPGDLDANKDTLGYDDYIADTPPQADATYCNFPHSGSTTGSSCPTFPLLDACSNSGNGIMFMNYMDYVNDAAMMMFTTQQAAVMRASLITESYSLTQNSGLLGVNNVATSAFNVYPNPAADAIHIALDGSAKLLGIDIVNIMGQSLSHTIASGVSNYTIPTASMPRGVYFVQCRFAEGTITKKIVLE